MWQHCGGLLYTFLYVKCRKIENSLGTEDSSWSLATEKIKFPCTPAGLYFIYQLWECLLSVVLEYR